MDRINLLTLYVVIFKIFLRFGTFLLMIVVRKNFKIIQFEI